jgi:hypothetical protein
MKIKELLDVVFKDGPVKHEKFNITDYCLYGKHYLENIKEEILKCEEFSECTELTILDNPAYENDGESYMVQTYKVIEGQKFGGKGFLLSISLSPEIFNPETIHKPVKDGACITPTLYDPLTFEPTKKIVLQFSPERVQDGISNNVEVIRQELHDLLDKVLDNPQDYQIKGERSVLVRGIFEKNEDGTITHSPQYLNGIDTEPKSYIVYYFDKEIKNDGEVTINLKTKLIPKELKDKFIEELGDKKLEITEKEINDFLEKYN